MAPADNEHEDDEENHLDERGARSSNAYSATIDPHLPALTFEQQQSDFVSPVTHVEGRPALRNQSFEEDEAPSTDGRIGCFSLCERTEQ